MMNSRSRLLALTTAGAICLLLCVLAAGRAPAAGGDAQVGKDARLPPTRLFPDADPWNQDVSKEPVDPNSKRIIATIGADAGLHPDFGNVYDGQPNGIPYVIVGGDQPKVRVEFEYADESDPGPYAIPPDAPIERPRGDGDRHVIVVDRDNNKLYELFHAYPQDGGKWWKAASGAIWDLGKVSYGQRPKGWTSADAAGLPILPGLVRYEEVEAGAVRHAIRFTVKNSRRGYVPPATHFASRKADPDLPPMGMRVRLRADYDDSKFAPRVRVITKALKTYGLILADNGSNWYLNGVPDPRWDDNELRQLRRIKGGDMEVIRMGEVVTR